MAALSVPAGVLPLVFQSPWASTASVIWAQFMGLAALARTCAAASRPLRRLGDAAPDLAGALVRAGRGSADAALPPLGTAGAVDFGAVGLVAFAVVGLAVLGADALDLV